MLESQMLLSVMVVFMVLGYNNKHLLNCLILLETLALVAYLTMSSTQMASSLSASMVLCFFVVTVASASLGLALLVAVCRSHGQDYFNSYNLSF